MDKTNSQSPLDLCVYRIGLDISDLERLYRVVFVKISDFSGRLLATLGPKGISLRERCLIRFERRSKRSVISLSSFVLVTTTHMPDRWIRQHWPRFGLEDTWPP